LVSAAVAVLPQHADRVVAAEPDRRSRPGSTGLGKDSVQGDTYVGVTILTSRSAEPAAAARVRSPAGRFARGWTAGALPGVTKAPPRRCVPRGSPAASLRTVEPVPPPPAGAQAGAANPMGGPAGGDLAGRLDPESRAWLAALNGHGRERDEALGRLHGLLVRAARFELNRRRQQLARLPWAELDDLALQAASDAMVAVLARLNDFRGLSRFSTWAYKFALLHASVMVRSTAWREREIPRPPEDWGTVVDRSAAPEEAAEHAELLTALRAAVEEILTPHQREVLLTIVAGKVPIDVLAERLGTSRGAVYKTVHDARRKLRAHLADAGLLNGREGRR
jgi:RNA polymerase sigma-70 factor, ECF subfamily